jgi:hypothetical protein
MVDDQFELARLLDRQVRGLGAFEDASGVDAGETKGVRQIGSMLSHHAVGPLSDEELIKSAESAAPAAIAKEATIIAVTAEGKIRTVRKGTNNFTCMADNPSTPGPDPMF